MVKDSTEAHQEGQEQHLVGNGLLQVTVTAIIFNKWHVDNESPYHERLYFLDGISINGYGMPIYLRAWWDIPLDDLALSDELDNKVSISSILTLSSNFCSVQPSEGFLFVYSEEPFPKDFPQLAIDLKAPEYFVVDPATLDSHLLALLQEVQEAHTPPPWGESRPVSSQP